MSSLKNIIMDVDVEPLESLSRRSKEAAQLQGDLDQNPQASQSPKLDVSDPQQPDIKRRRSSRVPKSSSQSSPSRPSLPRRRSSGTVESMESYGNQAGSSQPSSGMGIPRQSSRGPNPPEPHIRYTPVTGRVSRAKKGQPVHVCDQCDPPRIFTRAEHLRRHQLGHQKPAYPCTFEDCEKAFHRPDLLARHLHRHETQGEKAFKSDNPRSRSSSMSSTSQTPPIKKGGPLNVQTAVPPQISPAGSATPRTSASSGSGMTATVYEPIIMTEFGTMNFSGASNEQSGRSGTSPFGRTFSAEPSVTDHVHHNASYMTDMNPSAYPNTHGQAPAGQMYQGAKSLHDILPLTVQVPESTYPNPASYNSPWYSSDNSAWSTPSTTEVNRIPGLHRDRSSSIATLSDWNPQPAGWGSPPFGSATLQPFLDSSAPPFRHGAGLSHAAGGFTMELVGTPTPVTNLLRPYTQLFSASTPRVFKPNFSICPGGRYPLVDAPHINSFLTSTSPTQMNECVPLYLENLENFITIIHPHTHNLLPHDLLQNAMAALGSQYSDRPEHRKASASFYRRARTKILAAQQSETNFQTMQAIFLTEVFARFRSYKFETYPSLPFRKLCNKLADSSAEDSRSIYARLDVREINDAITIQQNSQAIPTPSRELLIENMWEQWIEWEVRQRLRVACYAFDTHQAIYYEQERCQQEVTIENTFFALPCSSELWNATTSQEWFGLIHNSDCATRRFSSPVTLTLEELVQLPFSTQCMTITSLVAALPPWDRQQVSTLIPSDHLCLRQVKGLFPEFSPAHASLAFYHTPLKQLLALTGESWVLGKKIASSNDFSAMKPIIRSWIGSRFGEVATWHACNFLRLCFASCCDSTKPFHIISDYWPVYTCTLIVWAFGQRPQKSLPNSGSSSATLSPRTGASALDSSEDSEVLNKALLWTETMASHPPERLASLSIRRDTAAVMEAARSRLATELSASCQPPVLLLDAYHVLEKLSEESPKLF